MAFPFENPQTITERSEKITLHRLFYTNLGGQFTGMLLRILLVLGALAGSSLLKALASPSNAFFLCSTIFLYSAAESTGVFVDLISSPSLSFWGIVHTSSVWHNFLVHGTNCAWLRLLAFSCFFCGTSYDVESFGWHAECVHGKLYNTFAVLAISQSEFFYLYICICILDSADFFWIF